MLGVFREVTDEFNRGWEKKSVLFALFLANIAPVYMLISQEWSLFLLIYAYWLECCVVGFYTVLRYALTRRFHQQMPVAESADEKKELMGAKVFMGLILFGHLGGFLFISHLFLLQSVDHSAMGPPRKSTPWSEIRSEIIGEQGPYLVWTIGFWLVLHGADFVANYLMNGRFMTAGAVEESFRPYGRFAVLMIAMMLFAALSMGTGTIIAGILLCLGKLWIDLMVILRRNRRYEQEAEALPAPKEELGRWVRR